MTLLVTWVVFPVALGALSLGAGLLLERGSGARLPGPLLLPVGFAGLVVVCDLASLSATTARESFTIALVVVVAGFASVLLPGSPRQKRRRPDRWLLAAALLVFAVYAAPVVLSGEATFAGYGVIDDTAVWFALIDHVLAAGRSLSGLPPTSSYGIVVREYLGSGYPVGSMMPLGVSARLVGQDIAWVFQPYLAFQGALLALALWELTGGLVSSRGWRAFIAFVAAEPALLYGYSLVGSIKELVTTPLVVVVVVLVARVLRQSDPSARTLLPIAIASAALFDTLNIGAAPWLLPALAPLVLLATRVPSATVLKRSALLLGPLVVCSLPMLATARTFTSVADTAVGPSTPSGPASMGELLHRLSYLQPFGIWPSNDFRTRPHTMWPTELLLAVLLGLAVCGVTLAIRRRTLSVPLYLVTGIVSCGIVLETGTPWTIGKAFAITSPIVLVTGLVGAALLAGSRMRILAVAGSVAVAGGVLWSNALAYTGVTLAPRAQLAQQQEIGQRFAGQGPTLLLGLQWNYAEHFLRQTDAVWLSGDWNTDAVPLASLLRFKTLVIENGPLDSRPPSAFRVVWSGRYYDVWQQVGSPPSILRHVSLGSGIEPAGVPSCSSVRALAALAASAGGRLAYVARSRALGFELGTVTHPADWTVLSNGSVFPTSEGAAAGSIDVTNAGRYGVWFGGFTPGHVTVSVDGRVVGSVSHLVEHPDQYFPIGTIDLSAGDHNVVVDYSQPVLQPGSRSTIPDTVYPYTMGPVVFSTQTSNSPVQYLAPSQAASLCGRSLDWIDALSH